MVEIAKIIAIKYKRLVGIQNVQIYIIKNRRFIMKAIFFLICAMFSMNVIAQRTNLDTLNESNRNNYLISLSKEIVKTFGPDYYRNMTPVIIDGVFETTDERPEIKKNVGREYYEVIYPYNNSKEVLDFDFSAKVKVWKDTGEPLEVIFGNGYGRNFFFIPYDELIKERSAIEQIPYEQAKVQKAKFVGSN